MAGADMTLPPISNYKGVMLCDRPSAPNASIQRNNGPKPFLSAVMPIEQLGMNPPKKVHQVAVQESVKPKASYLDKHKQWLREFSKFKEYERSEKDRQFQMEEEKRKEFDDYSKRLRDAIRNGTNDVPFLVPGQREQKSPTRPLHGTHSEPGGVGRMLLREVLGEDDHDGMAAAVSAAQARVSAREPVKEKKLHIEERRSSEPDVREFARTSQEEHKEMDASRAQSGEDVDAERERREKKEKERRRKEILALPAWSLTEEKAAERDEFLEEQEIDGLLDFVAGLDYDRYIEDFEVRQALEVVKQRVYELQQSKQVDEDPEAVQREAERRKQLMEQEMEMRQNDADWNSSTKVGEDPERPATQASMKEAERLMQLNKKLRTIHSIQSLGNVMEQAAREEAELRGDGSIVKGRLPIPPKREILPQNLPYLHRNPAV